MSEKVKVKITRNVSVLPAIDKSVPQGAPCGTLFVVLTETENC